MKRCQSCTDLRKNLRNLVESTEAFLTWMDEEMKRPSDATRGSRIAQACNALELQKDLAKHFGLGRKL